jgi:flavodoxin I
MTVHVIYGSDSGRTKAVAGKIAAKLDGKIIDVSNATTADFEACDLLVLGSPTYGEGDLQADWETGIDVLAEADLTGKKVALFGLGDQSTYPDSFADTIGTLYDVVVERGAEVCRLDRHQGLRV